MNGRIGVTKRIAKKLMPFAMITVLSAAPEDTSYEVDITERCHAGRNAAEFAQSFRDIPLLEAACIDTTPPDQGDGIAVASLESGRDEILELAQEIIEGTHGATDSLLIVHDGALVFESYFARGRTDLPHPLASATKSLTSLAVARAIQLGHLSMEDLDRTVAALVGGLQPAEFAGGAGNITLKQALSMRTGLRYDDDAMAALDANPTTFKGRKQAQAILALSSPIPLGISEFLYQGSDPRLVMQVLDAAVPGGAEAFISQELFAPLGITNFDWQEDESGLPASRNGASLTARDLLKIGLLMSNGGQWGDQQLISEDFLREAMIPKSKFQNGEVFFTSETVLDAGYGFFFWTANMKVGDARFATVSAQGGGGQYVITFDSLDLIIVTTGHKRDDQTMKLVADRILPFFSTTDRSKKGT